MGYQLSWLEHLLCKQDVKGSSPLCSNFGGINHNWYWHGLENRSCRKACGSSSLPSSAIFNIAIIAFIIDGYLAQRQRRRTQNAYSIRSNRIVATTFGRLTKTALGTVSKTVGCESIGDRHLNLPFKITECRSTWQITCFGSKLLSVQIAPF